MNWARPSVIGVDRNKANAQRCCGDHCIQRGLDIVGEINDPKEE